MTAIDRGRATAAFKRYTDAYDAANPRIALNLFAQINTRRSRSDFSTLDASVTVFSLEIILYRLFCYT